MYRVKLRGKTNRKDSKAVVVQGKLRGIKRKDSKAVVVQGKLRGEDQQEG